MGAGGGGVAEAEGRPGQGLSHQRHVVWGRGSVDLDWLSKPVESRLRAAQRR
jgi:hypothetical protein